MPLLRFQLMLGACDSCLAELLLLRALGGNEAQSTKSTRGFGYSVVDYCIICGSVGKCAAGYREKVIYYLEFLSPHRDDELNLDQFDDGLFVPGT
ncbi:unnamed protein product [Clavelina lepadiformis]|uniref:Uncharacterized protein n=1 Tax=Clavelina lepadiformis TaxID=159417 RepID=A0ABP0FFV9_CLALP